MDNLDLAAILENNFLAYIRTSSLFFIAGLALFNFTNLGKNFSLISLTIGLILLISVVTDYFVERHRISKLGFHPRTVVDIMAFVLIAVIFLFMWVIYSAWRTTPTSISDLSKNIERELERGNIFEHNKDQIRGETANVILQDVKQQNILTNASLASTT